MGSFVELTKEWLKNGIVFLYFFKENIPNSIHVYKQKTTPVETTPGMEVRGVKENDGVGELNYDI
jgi:hypothetical protein